ncbi:recombination regulator RecX [Klebsiella quasipneumoniae]|uniref:recombination regulator RecX n=1 Tax=Klebsiella quasipneumoniae TaxID=1463165 RepID=UPI00083FD7DC|nr:recombination regulator RecX [Klebsiella quasipneumoniae]HBQ6719043.1 recombination regulator RecX [Klebsiella quasipneumoniae subsp. similipneumoniae]EKZ5695727.1 recombination regulator RecX [Klebsiella quasipneumoniae]MCU4141465.1 recombination regulator RecX [Klebsiella quasipneumoniae]MCU4147474.1 recombination regulator RecX [Klebsiella quasipneumoniae]MDZ0677867.1 recombination regulator RecX [Klebsiella quasipneumoniae]
MTEPSSRRSGYARLLDRAIRILAMRDHSVQELRRKLAAPVMSKNGPEALDVTPEELEQVVAWCIENRYLDDNRFVGQFIASRSRKGYGPARIRQELSQKGIARQAVEQAMRECDIDWVSLARAQAQRKYGEPLPSAFAEKVKIQRFLLYRGYLMEDIQEIWRNFAD